MLDIAIIALLFMGFFMGLRRGFILQLIHLAGFIAAYIVAKMYCDELAPKLALWIPYPDMGDNSPLKFFAENSNMQLVFYRAVAFFIIFFAVKILLQIVGSMLNFVAQLPVIKQLNVWAGGILGFIEVYFVLFILLYIAALMPMEVIQGYLKESYLADAIVKHTPILSDELKRIWTEYVAA